VLKVGGFGDPTLQGLRCHHFPDVAFYFVDERSQSLPLHCSFSTHSLFLFAACVRVKAWNKRVMLSTGKRVKLEEKEPNLKMLN